MNESCFFFCANREVGGRGRVWGEGVQRNPLLGEGPLIPFSYSDPPPSEEEEEEGGGRGPGQIPPPPIFPPHYLACHRYFTCPTSPYSASTSNLL